MDGDQLESPCLDHVAVGERPLAVVRIERVHGDAEPFGEPPRPRGVIGVVVRQQDGCHVTRGPPDLLQVRSVIRAGIDHHARPIADDPCVGSLERVRARVRGEHADREP
jgi:hypothetical protein